MVAACIMLSEAPVMHAAGDICLTAVPPVGPIRLTGFPCTDSDGMIDWVGVEAADFC